MYEVDFNEDTSMLMSCGKTDYARLYPITGTTFSNPFNTSDRNKDILCCRFLANSSSAAYGDK